MFSSVDVICGCGGKNDGDGGGIVLGGFVDNCVLEIVDDGNDGVTVLNHEFSCVVNSDDGGGLFGCGGGLLYVVFF